MLQEREGGVDSRGDMSKSAELDGNGGDERVCDDQFEGGEATCERQDDFLRTIFQEIHKSLNNIRIIIQSLK